ncbi:MAG: sulfatase-like hydrolase/transferase [Candidatus Lokiarchaeota archaeon]|nr:sulfatase-like hydrolase/transferase [Candidatus Lokiarchaeota archaeon]
MSKSKRPNIVIFNPDEWRGDVLGHVGNPAAHTPNLDKFVEEDAVSFRNAFCQLPVCSPSRCSFMTGWYPHTRGHRTMHYLLHPEHYETNLLKILKENGYFVWWGGKNDLVPGQDGHYKHCNKKYIGTFQYLKNLKKIISQEKVYPRNWRGDPGGDNYYSFYVGKVPTEDGNEFYTRDVARVDGAISFIKKYRKRKPFCVYLPLSFPHPQYAVDDPWFSIIDREKLPERPQHPANWEGKPKILKGIWENQNISNWSEDRWNELRATYYGMCAKIDDCFGKLISALKENGQYNNTAIFFLSDHGDFAGDYGLVEKNQNTFEDCLSRVPFIIKLPKSLSTKPQVSDALVELVDFSETVFEITGISPEYTRFGKSLVPLLRGEAEEHRDAVFCEGGRLIGETQAMERESKSSQNPAGLYWPRISLQGTDEKAYHGKATMIRTKKYKYILRKYEKNEFYDLEKDPQEINNQIDNPKYQDKIQKFKERMLEWYMETCDCIPVKTDNRGFRPNIKNWLKNLLRIS